MVDVELYTRELTDLDRQESYNDLFHLIGMQVTEAHPRSVSALSRRRLPWLLATLAGGFLAAVVTDLYAHVATLALVVLFIPLVLALAGSVAAQSVSLALRTLHVHRSSWGTLLPEIRLELATGAFLGVMCGLVAGGIALAWKGDPILSLDLLISIVGSVVCAAVLGFTTPYLLWMFQRNPQVAAGPIALASADAVALVVYFSLAGLLLA